MPSFWSHSAHKTEKMQCVSSTQNKSNPTQSNNNNDITNMPGLTLFVMHTMCDVSVVNKVGFFMDDVIIPKDAINQYSADRPPIGNPHVFLGAAKSMQQKIGNVRLQMLFTLLLRTRP